MNIYGIKKVWIFFTAILLLFFTSCSKDNLEQKQELPDISNTINGGDINFKIGFTPHTRVNTDMGFRSYWDDGDAIGIFAVSRMPEESASLNASDNYIHNVKITYSSTGEGTWTVSENLYFPGGGKVLDFYAYYPYDVSKNDPTNIIFNIKSDQNTNTGGKSNYDLSEVLAAKTTGIASGTTVDLSFIHSLVMMHVKVYGKDFNSYPPQVEVRKVNTSSKLNFNTIGNPAATATGATWETVTMRLVAQDYQATNNDTLTYRALIPVQVFEKGRPVFNIQYRDKAFTSPILTSDLAFTAGTAHIYKQGSVSGIFTAEDLLQFANAWNATENILNETSRKSAQDKIIAEWSDTGDKDGVVRVWADINMEGKSCTPIGLNNNNVFTGKFDGGGFVISNLTIDRGTERYAGLFGLIKNSEIRNVVLDKCDMKSNWYTSGIAGYSSGSTISGCHVKNSTLISSGSCVGGITGDNRDGIINDCEVTNTTITGLNYSGGIIGNNMDNTTVTGCKVKEATVTANSNYSGGIVGYSASNSIIAGCDVNETNISAKSYSGGIAGGNSSKINGSLVTGGTISSEDSYSGGVTGNNNGSVAGCIASPNGINGTLKGIISGYNNNVITACYWGKLNGINAVGNDAILSGNGFDRIDFGSFFSLPNINNSGITPIEDMNTAISDSGYRWITEGSGQYPIIIKQ